MLEPIWFAGFMTKNRDPSTALTTPAPSEPVVAPATRRPRLKHPKEWGRPHPAHGPVRLLPRRRDGSIPAYYYMSPEQIEQYRVDPPLPDVEPAAPTPPAVLAARRSGMFDLSGRELAPTHPDHGPMHLLPRQEDGTFSAFYYCTKDELAAGGMLAPPPRRQRRDGWNAERMATFIRVLRATASVTDAARAADLSRQSAYALYAEPDAQAFREAWDEALRGAVGVLAATAFDRAVNGVEEIVYHKGERIGVRWKYDNRLLTFLLRVRDPLNFASPGELNGRGRHRALEPRGPIEPALERLAAAETAWGSSLPGEATAAPALAAPADQPSLVSSLSGSEQSGGIAAQASLVSGLSASDTSDAARD